tara:strand:+ start:1648 stop:2973 length:1326 start_codon:yes stop_codon:yes gene_type:complete
MKISIIGSGYVGLVAAACFAEMGNQVICIDIDANKINSLKKGDIPIYEPGLEKLVQENMSKGDLSFSTDITNSLDAEIVFIAVGTPMGEDGSADLKYVLEVAKSIGDYMNNNLIVVNKSTVPIGTADKVKKVIQDSLDKRDLELKFNIVSNPEFLKEGVAIKDFMHPDRVVIGSDDDESIEKMRRLYAPFILSSDRFIAMDIRSAEMTKYAANAMLATKISFINEIANICERVGADVNKVRLGIGSDQRIGYKFIYPGCGYGGSCFPKDVKALIKIANSNNYNAHLISAVEEVNNIQKNVLFSKVQKNFGDKIKDMTFAIWGLSFKPETDDMREAPSINLIKSIISNGGIVNAYDPKAILESKYYLKDYKVNYFEDKYSVLEGADVLVLVTEWKEFRSPDFNKVLQLMNGRVIIDGRNQFNKNLLNSLGFRYLQIGVKDMI